MGATVTLTVPPWGSSINYFWFWSWFWPSGEVATADGDFQTKSNLCFRLQNDPLGELFGRSFQKTMYFLWSRAKTLLKKWFFQVQDRRLVLNELYALRSGDSLMARWRGTVCWSQVVCQVIYSNTGNHRRIRMQIPQKVQETMRLRDPKWRLAITIPKTSCDQEGHSMYCKATD